MNKQKNMKRGEGPDRNKRGEQGGLTREHALDGYGLPARAGRPCNCPAITVRHGYVTARERNTLCLCSRNIFIPSACAGPGLATAHIAAAPTDQVPPPRGHRSSWLSATASYRPTGVPASARPHPATPIHASRLKREGATAATAAQPRTQSHRSCVSTAVQHDDAPCKTSRPTAAPFARATRACASCTPAYERHLAASCIPQTSTNFQLLRHAAPGSYSSPRASWRRPDGSGNIGHQSSVALELLELRAAAGQPLGRAARPAGGVA